jgi:hypothetical protein
VQFVASRFSHHDATPSIAHSLAYDARAALLSLRKKVRDGRLAEARSSISLPTAPRHQKHNGDGRRRRGTLKWNATKEDGSDTTGLVLGMSCVQAAKRECGNCAAVLRANPSRSATVRNTDPPEYPPRRPAYYGPPRLARGVIALSPGSAYVPFHHRPLPVGVGG